MILIPSTNVEDLELKELLTKAENYVDSSPDSANFYAKKLFLCAESKKDHLYSIQSLIIQGTIHKFKGELEKAAYYYTLASELAHNNKLVSTECHSVLNIGEVLYKKGEYDRAYIQFLKADSLARVFNLSGQKFLAWYYLGKYNQTKGNFANAKFYYYKALTIARKNKNEKHLALLLPSLGKYYISEGKLNLALKCYQEAYNISKHLNDHLLNADISNHLGGLYLELNEVDKSMEYHRTALQLRSQMNFPGELAKSYNNIGKIQLRLKKRDSAEFYFNSSLLLSEKAGYKKGKVKALANLGEVYRINKQYAKALEVLHTSFKISTAIGYDHGIAEAAMNIGELYRDVRNTDSAIFYYNLALNKLAKTSYYEQLTKVYFGLYSSYIIKHDYQSAINAHEALLETEKKLLNVENKRQLAIVKLAFDKELNDQDYRVLLKDNELKASLIKSKNTLIWLFVTILCFTILLCLYIYNRFYLKKEANKKLEKLNITITNQNSQLKKLNKEIESVSKEKDKLFAIISHELRNPLYWLQNLAEALSKKHSKMSADKVSKTLISMDESAKNVYHLMDNLLHWSRNKLNRVHPKKQVHNLFNLITETIAMYETFLQQKEILCTVEITKNIQIFADADLFACIIRNLLSNAIKFTPKGGAITFQQTLDIDHVTVRISDNGKGMSEVELESIFSNTNSISMPGLTQEKGTGLGLKLCKDFVEMNDGRIWAESKPGKGTSVCFTTPIHLAVSKNFEEMELERM
jgi:signal transduction histidine kinase/Tfp pilus assembly protein PilF